MMELSEGLRERIFELTGFTRANKIDRGYSFEDKYLLEGGDGRKFMLRITRLARKEDAGRKEEEFRLINEARRYCSLVPKTHYFGVSGDDGLCYLILDYICGADGEEALPGLSRKEQYELGLDAGRELRNLHGMNAPHFDHPWHERYSAKYARKCAIFDEMKVNPGIIDLKRISRFISGNSCHLECRRESFLHDDFHPANLIIGDGRLKGIIDFARYDWGDPVHDFVKLAYFSSDVSIPFAVGQIDGYNDGDVPGEFWKKYSLYSAMTIIPDIVWSFWYSREKGSPEQVERMWKRVNRVYLDHDGFSSGIPRWYLEFEGD
jgi:aminoglycoside phosphotransferase (APT) family kinase protein